MTILTFIWQLPQNLLALIILLINAKSVIKTYNPYLDITYYLVKHLNNSGISLGNFIILDSDRTVIDNTLKHEHGHQIQSLILGWLYLIIIGIPSFLGNIYDQIFHKQWTLSKRYHWYYNQPWEKQADKLGKVNRN